MGPAHGGFEFLKGNFAGFKGYVVGRMTKSHRGKLYIDDAGWGPETSSIEHWLCAGHEDHEPVWRLIGVRNTVAIGTAPKPTILQLVQRFSFTR